MILCHCFCGRGWHLLLPQKPAANNEVQTAGCGVRPPRVTGRTIPLTPPTWLPCVSLGVGDYERACEQSAFSDFVMGIWLSVELCFDIFPVWHAAPPPAPHTGQGSVNYKRIWWEVCLRKRIRCWLMCPEKEANQWKINGFVTNVVQPNCVCDCLCFKRWKMAHL